MAASILLAALVGGVVFVLLDSWHRRAATPAIEPEPAWRPEAGTEPLPRRVAPPVPRHDDPEPPSRLWSGWARR